MITKICSKCKDEKPISEFYKQSDRSSRQSYCKKCFNSYCTLRWIKIKINAINYKGGKCVDCDRKLSNENPYYLFDFHHVDPTTKDCDWRKLRMRNWEKIKKELDKCVCVCTICHRHREYKDEMVVLGVGLEPTTLGLENRCCYPTELPEH